MGKCADMMATGCFILFITHLVCTLTHLYCNPLPSLLTILMSKVGKSADMIVTSEGRDYSTCELECRHDGDRMFDTTHYDSQE